MELLSLESEESSYSLGKMSGVTSLLVADYQPTTSTTTHTEYSNRFTVTAGSPLGSAEGMISYTPQTDAKCNKLLSDATIRDPLASVLRLLLVFGQLHNLSSSLTLCLVPSSTIPSLFHGYLVLSPFLTLHNVPPREEDWILRSYFPTSW